MQKLEVQKGITLIALIITIIVMLILVGVTVTVALNGELFTTAKEAADQTKIATEKEQLLSAVIGTIGINGQVDFDKLDNYLPDNFEKIGEKTYKSTDGNTYIISAYGEITLVGESGEEPEPVVVSITLSTTQISKEITSGTPETVELTATLNNASGDLAWESSDSTVAEISGSGNARTITLKKAGTATITVSYAGATAICSVTVTEKVATIISFTIEGITYNAEEGMTWEKWVENTTYNTGGYKLELAYESFWVIKNDSVIVGTSSVDNCGPSETIEADYNYVNALI